jgi:lysophospholipase L1-like esterase
VNTFCRFLSFLFIVFFPVFAADPAKPVVVMFGDSTTQCTLNCKEGRLPYLIEKCLAGKAEVINAGLNGETATAALRRVNDAVLQHNPDLVCVMYGLNDVFKSNFTEFSASLPEIIQKIKPAKIMLITCLVPRYSVHNIKKYVWTDSALACLEKEMAFVRWLAAHDTALALFDLHLELGKIIDMNPFLPDVLLLKDGVHASDFGNQVEAWLIAPKIAELLERRKS